MAEMTKKIICSICLDDFKQPILIDCQHTFCLRCLEDYINKVSANNRFPCPLCFHHITVPVGGVGEFPPNLNIAERLVSKKEIPKCGACKTGVNFTFRCKNFFQRCWDFIFINVDGTSVDPDPDNPHHQFQDVCPNHHGREARCYCTDCSRAICSDCFVTSHSSHKFIDLYDKGIADQSREELRSLKENLRNRITEFEKYCQSIENVISDINKSAKTSCKDVDEQVERICCEAKEYGEDFKVQIETSRADETQKLARHRGEMKVLIDELKASVEYSIAVLGDKSIAQVISRIARVQEEKKESSLRKLDMPDVKYTRFKKGVINKTFLLRHLGAVKIG